MSAVISLDFMMFSKPNQGSVLQSLPWIFLIINLKLMPKRKACSLNAQNAYLSVVYVRTFVYNGRVLQIMLCEIEVVFQ